MYNNWGQLASPPRDPATPETFLSNSVYFTTREYATNPQRIHSFQISVRAGPRKTTPEEVGALVTYKVEAELFVHIWAIAGIGNDFETTENLLQNMVDQTDAIIRLQATNASSSGIQFVRLAPGEANMDDLNRVHVFHRVMRVTAIYYRTEASVPGSFHTGTYNGADNPSYDSQVIYA